MKKFDPSKIKIAEKPWKNNFVYYTGYKTIQKIPNTQKIILLNLQHIE